MTNRAHLDDLYNDTVLKAAEYRDNVHIRENHDDRLHAWVQAEEAYDNLHQQLRSGGTQWLDEKSNRNLQL